MFATVIAAVLLVVLLSNDEMVVGGATSVDVTIEESGTVREDLGDGEGCGESSRAAAAA